MATNGVGKSTSILPKVECAPTASVSSKEPAATWLVPIAKKPDSAIDCATLDEKSSHRTTTFSALV